MTTKAEREEIAKAIKLLEEFADDEAMEILRKLAGDAVHAGPSYDREDVGIGHDKTQIVDYPNERLGAA